jgi:FkbH-like protein
MPPVTRTFNELKKNLKKDFSGLKKVKAALLGDSSTQFLSQALKGYGYGEDLNLDIFEADYNQVYLQIADRNSELYGHQPHYVIIFHSVQKLLTEFYKADHQQKVAFADNKIAELEGLFGTLNNYHSCRIIYFNFPEINDGVFGNYSNKAPHSFSYQLRKLNYELMNLAGKMPNVFIHDLSAIQSQYGAASITDPKFYVNADITLSIDILPVVAKNITDIIQACEGSFKKALIIDLDNTMWGGVIGDDGIENIRIGDLGIGKAFSELQLWFKQLKERGIILAVCSKNTESIAMEPFKDHPDMVLRLEDIAVFVANWESKVDNIRYIQSILNIGFDSLVFLDDNPFERNIVRENFPAVTVPELPEDPAEYLTYLRTLNLFETASYSDNDADRTKQYQEEAGRSMLERSFTSEDDFLKSLGMQAQIASFDKFNAPRIAQLSQRSNQFNLRTVRYTEGDILSLISSDSHFTFAFNLTDKFGSYGLISIIILEKRAGTLFIDTWIMSCRVLRRGMEGFALNHIVEIAAAHGYKTITGEYIPTAKNALVKDHYQRLGFTGHGDLWTLDVAAYSPLNNYITPSKEEIKL